MNWTVIIWIICCLLAVFLVWKEYQREKKAHLILRIAASLLAAIALALIVLPIKYAKNVTVVDEHTAILLTAGYEQDSLTAGLTNLQIFTADRVIAKAYRKAKLIRLDELKTDSPAITKLQLFGYGLNETELDQLGHLPVVFHPVPSPDGVSTVSWNQKLRTGELLSVQGQFRNTSSQPVKLVLKGLNTQLDTITIPPKTTKNFELDAVPKNEGRAVYHLQAIKGTDTLTDENLPIEIIPIKPVKILMLSASPDFETKFLKNWLSENGFSVAVRSTISKGKYSSEYVNMQPLKIGHLSAALLDKFDLVIGDLSELKTEGAVLKQQVIQKGLGIIIRADSSSRTSSWLQKDFPVDQLNIKNPPPVALIIRGEKIKTLTLRIDPAFIRPQSGTQSLVSDAQNRIVVNSSLAGLGRLTFTTINNTFNWMLAGNRGNYAAFWSLLISKTAQKDSVAAEWSVSQLPTVNERVKLQFQTSSDAGKISVGNSIVAPAQDPSILFEWQSDYWPQAAGWQSIKQNNDEAKWWYVYGENEWGSARASKRISATSNYAADYKDITSVTKPVHEILQIELPKIYFYLLLLVAVTFLWIEGKLARQN